MLVSSIFSIFNKKAGFLIVLGFNATLTSKVIVIMEVSQAHVFPGFLTPVLTQLFFPKPRLLFSNTYAEVRHENTPERRRLNCGLNSQPPGHESDTAHH